MLRWREAMASALYGPAGFFVRPGTGPADHFRTSAVASPQFAEAVAALLVRLDDALGHPHPLTVVDIGAGRGELLSALGQALPARVAARLRPVAVELADRAEGGLQWRQRPPAEITGLVIATEWLDNVPVDVAELTDAGRPRYLLVDPARGEQALGEPVSGPDADWLERWWPLADPGTRAEIGRPRDQAWAAAVGTLRRGAALAVDYGHLLPAGARTAACEDRRPREQGAAGARTAACEDRRPREQGAAGRPPFGTLTGFREGREVPPVPDGSCDLTAHVAIDAVAESGRAAAGGAVPVLCRQAAALPALGVSGSRPPLALAHRDPGGYLRQLAAASAAAELTDPAGLGGHYWLLQPVALGVDVTGWLA